MELEANRLYKFLYDLASENEISQNSGITFKDLLSQANSENFTDRQSLIHLIYNLIKISKDYFVFTVKSTTTRRRKNEDILDPKMNFPDFEAKISKIKDDLSKNILILLSKQMVQARKTKFLELLYNKAKNFDTYAIYKYIEQAGPNGITYAQISQKYNREYGPEKHLSPIKIANYCKKMLEKNGFIQSVQASADSVGKGTERVCVLTKFAYKEEQKEILKVSANPLAKNAQKRLLQFSEKDEPKKLKSKEKLLEHASELDKIKQETQGLTMRQIIGFCIKSELAQKNNGLTIGEIAYVLNMEKEKKAVNRVVEDMTKSNPLIYGSTEGSGKVRFNKYVLTSTSIKKEENIIKKEEMPIKTLKKEENQNLPFYYGKFEKLAEILEQEGNPIIENLNLLHELNENSYENIVNLLDTKIPKFKKKYGKEKLKNSDFRKLVIKTALVGIIEESEHGQKQKKRREIAPETLNRYIFVLNKIEENQIISMLEIINCITNELEKSHGITIARKTVKKIGQNLTKSGLINTAEFTVNLCPSEEEKATATFSRYIFFSTKVPPDDERIKEKSMIDPKAPKIEPKEEQKESDSEIIEDYISKPKNEDEKLPEISQKIDLTIVKISLSERREELLKKVLSKFQKFKLFRYFAKYKENIQKQILHTQLTKFNTEILQPKIQSENLTLSLISYWKNTDLPIISEKLPSVEKAQNSINYEKMCKIIENSDNKIKIKQKMNKISYEKSVNLLLDLNFTEINSKIPNISLMTIIKKMKNIKQGKNLIKLLYSNGIIDIKQAEILYKNGIFEEKQIEIPENTEDFSQYKITENEFFTELQKEKYLLHTNL